MPMKYSDYPDNWQDIRKQVLEREDHKCKWCGVPNYAIGARNVDGKFISDVIIGTNIYNDGWMQHHFGDAPEPILIKIVLTIAHLGVPKYPCDPGDKYDTMDCRLINLAALCQQCHNRFDLPDRLINRKKTLMKKREQKIVDSGQLRLL